MGQKFKTYLFQCQENTRAYRILASKKWKKGDQVTLPPIRVRIGSGHKLYGQKYKVYLYKSPIFYGNSGYLPKKTWIIKTDINGDIKLKPVKRNIRQL